MRRHELPYPAAPEHREPASSAPPPVRHESPYPTGGSTPPPPPPQGAGATGALAERVAARRAEIDALKVGTARLRARVEPLREGTVAHLSVGTERLAARVARDSRPRW